MDLHEKIAAINTEKLSIDHAYLAGIRDCLIREISLKDAVINDLKEQLNKLLEENNSFKKPIDTTENDN